MLSRERIANLEKTVADLQQRDTDLHVEVGKLVGRVSSKDAAGVRKALKAEPRKKAASKPRKEAKHGKQD